MENVAKEIMLLREFQPEPKFIKTVEELRAIEVSLFLHLNRLLFASTNLLVAPAFSTN